MLFSRLRKVAPTASFGYKCRCARGRAGSLSTAAPIEPTGLRERKKQRTRELIASTALELFARHGYQATTVAEIAAAADVSERTVFTYFPTKEDILFSDHADFRDRLAAALEQRPAGASALDTLRDFVVENLSAIDESSRVRWEIVSHDEHLLSHQRARQVELGDTIAAAVAEELSDEWAGKPTTSASSS